MGVEARAGIVIGGVAGSRGGWRGRGEVSAEDGGVVEGEEEGGRVDCGGSEVVRQ